MKLYVITALLLSACEQCRDPEATQAPQQDSLTPPVITVIAELPDSSKPKTIYLDSVPAPLTVAVPTKEGGSYTVETYRGPVTFRLKLPQVIDHVDTLSHMPIPPEAQGTPAFTNFSSDEGLPTGRGGRLALRSVPYALIYRVESSEVRIIAVAHAKQRPGYWANR